MQSFHEHTGLNRKAYDARMLLPKRLERTMRHGENKRRAKEIPYSEKAKQVNERIRSSMMARCPTGLCAEPVLTDADAAAAKAAFEADKMARKQADQQAYAAWPWGHRRPTQE